MIRSERKRIFENSHLYPVVSSEFCAGRSVPEVVRALVQGGAQMLQFREKNLSGRERWNLATACRKITADAGVLMIVDDDLGLALACGADGIHLGQDDLPTSAARSVAPELLIGISTHNPEEIRAANAEDIDYLNIGPIFATQTKSVSYPAVGLENLKNWRHLPAVPWTVMGGIKRHNILDLKALGCQHIAMVTALTQAGDIAATTREIIGLMR